MRRCLLLCLALFAAAPSVAHAALSDRIVPYVDEDDGVRIVERAGVPRAVFAPQAAKVFARLAGRNVKSTCADVTPDGKGGLGTAASHRFRAPARRRALPLSAGGSLDLCWWSTRARRSERVPCLREDGDRWCVRAIVALNDEGRTRVDEVGRAWDLVLVFGVATLLGDGGAPSFATLEPKFDGALAALPARDASPPPGKVGYWTDGRAIVVATVTAAGVRRYLEVDGDLRSSNAMGLLEVSAPSLF